MENHEILSFLHVIGSTIIFLVGGLGVWGQDNALREIPILHHVIYICGIGSKGKSSDHTPDHLHWKNKFVIPLLLFLLASLGKILSLCRPSVLQYGQNAVSYVKSDIKS
jgi:hypothetical protein